MPILRTILTALIVALAAGSAQAASADCADMAKPARSPATATKRPMTERDLIELRDIGDSYSVMSGFAERLAVSPDGRRVAFSLARADLASNGYCLAVYVMDLRAGAVPNVVNTGGEYRQSATPLRGYFAYGGSMRPTIPVWSPDGRQVAFLRSDEGATQAWIAQADGSGSRRLTRSPGNVSSIGWGSDGKTLLYASSPSEVAERTAIDHEGKNGWLYDARVFASFQLKPLVAAEQHYSVYAVDLATGITRPATSGEAGRIANTSGLDQPAPPTVLAADGRRAWGVRGAINGIDAICARLSI